MKQHSDKINKYSYVSLMQTSKITNLKIKKIN